MHGPVDDLGDPVGLTGVPHRIVSLVPNLSEALWSWGLADRLVGVTEWCVEPADGFRRATRVRGTKNPDVAAIVDLAPDLVVCNEEENRRLDVQRLRSAGLAVHVTRAHGVLEAASSLRRLAAAVGRARAGAALAERIHDALARCAPPPAARARVFCAVWRDGGAHEPGDEVWWALGRDTYGGDLLARCGLDVVPGDAGGRYPRHRLADVAAADPDLVLLPDEPYPFGAPDEAPFADWRARVWRVDGRALWWWGPRTPAALDQLAGRRPQ